MSHCLRADLEDLGHWMGQSLPGPPVIMSPTLVIMLAVLTFSVSAMELDEHNKIPSFLPVAFPLPNGNASTCQTLCQMSRDCQYFVWMEGGAKHCSLVQRFVVSTLR